MNDVNTLAAKAATLDYQPAQLANGSVELLNEVAGSKITGEEDRYSHTDLSDFQGNLTGAYVAFKLLRPALRRYRQRRPGNDHRGSASPPSKRRSTPTSAPRLSAMRPTAS